MVNMLLNQKNIILLIWILEVYWIKKEKEKMSY